MFSHSSDTAMYHSIRAEVKSLASSSPKATPPTRPATSRKQQSYTPALFKSHQSLSQYSIAIVQLVSPLLLVLSHCVVGGTS